MGKEKRPGFYPLLLTALTLFLAVTSLSVTTGTAAASFLGKAIGSDILSRILSFATLAIIAISLNYVNSGCFLFASDSCMLWGSYLSMVFLLPGISCFTEYHIGALLMLYALFFMIKYMSEERFKPSLLFLSMLSVSAAAAMIPPLFPLPAVFVILALFGGNENILKSILTMLSALSLPLIYLFCCNYIFNTVSLTDYFGWYGETLSLKGPVFGRYTVMFIVYKSALILFLVRSVLSVILTYKTKNRTQKAASIVFLSVSLALAVVYLLYHTLVSPLTGMILLVPLSFAVYDFYHNAGEKERRTVLTIFIILSAAVRIYEMIGI